MINQKELNYKKLNLGALNKEDLVIFSTLCQDSIIKVSNIKWAKKSKSFKILITRLCWELHFNSKKKDLIRVNSIISFNSVLSVKSKGIAQSRPNVITTLLTLKYKSNSYENQSIDLIFSGDGQITLDVECIDAFLKDISEPFKSVLNKLPNHRNGFKY